MRPPFQSRPLPAPRAPLPFIWRDASLCAAPNTWTYFRKVFSWTPGRNGTSAYAGFAADPTARVWLNGRLVLDRTMRFMTPHIPVETLNLSPFLIAGENVLVVLHHWWGVPTFQRSPGGRPGIALVWDCEQNNAATDATWNWRDADEFDPHPHQTIGHDGARRIRFPVLLDTRREAPGLHAPAGDNRPDWRPAVPVISEAWACPLRKETPVLTLDDYIPAARLISTGRITRTASTAALPDHEVGRRIRETLHHPDRGAGVPPATWHGHPAHDSDVARASLPVSVASPRAAGVPPADDAQRRPLPSIVLNVQRSVFDDGAAVAASTYTTLDFARPVHGYLTLDIADAPAGAILEFGYGELATNPRDGAPLITSDGHFDPEFTCGSPFGDRVILRGGPQTVTLPEERTWRYLLVHRSDDNLATTVISRIACRTSQHPVTQTGAFEILDSQFQIRAPRFGAALVRLCLDHARITMSDTYVDTPGREDAQWLEDIQYRARLAATWFGDTALRQVTLRHAVEQQDPQTGLFRVFAPEDYQTSGCQFLDWGMTWIGLLHDDWQWTGQTTLLQRYYPALKKFLTALKHLTTADGLLTGENCLADNHGSQRLDHATGESGYESIPNTWYYGYLLQSAEIADALDESADAAEYRHRAARLRAAFRRFLTESQRPEPGGQKPEKTTTSALHSHDGSGLRTPDSGFWPLSSGLCSVAELWTSDAGPHAWGQAAVVNAIYHGLIPDRATARAMLQTAFPAPDGIPPQNSPIKRWNTPTTIYRALCVLSEHGLGPLAAAHLAATYGPHLPDGPLPEYFLSGPDRQPVDPTGSHGWAAVPLAWLHDTVLGVRYHHATPTTSARIVVKPHYAGWDTVSGTVVTPAGPVTVRIDWSARSLDVAAPDGVPVVKNLPVFTGNNTRAPNQEDTTPQTVSLTS
ncbi:alpha-L-rhamnosidase [Opitutaceae bacterium TAV5]|nr:alpha-L-rhamnosidase [Opitutaceae bacterium TAV5]